MTDQPPEQANNEPATAAVRLVTPTANDVLCGREKACFNHLGSRHFRQVIQSYRRPYEQALTKYDKMQLIKEICNKVRERSRFLKYNDEAGGWEEINIAASRDKVSHALRFANRSSPKRMTKEDPVDLEMGPDLEGPTGSSSAGLSCLEDRSSAASNTSAESNRAAFTSAAFPALAARLLAQGNSAGNPFHQAMLGETLRQAQQTAAIPPSAPQAQTPHGNTRVLEALLSAVASRSEMEHLQRPAPAAASGRQALPLAALAASPSTSVAADNPVGHSSSKLNNPTDPSQIAQMIQELQQRQQQQQQQPPQLDLAEDSQSHFLVQMLRVLQQRGQPPAPKPAQELLQELRQQPPPSRPSATASSNLSDAQLGQLIEHLQQQQQQRASTTVRTFNPPGQQQQQSQQLEQMMQSMQQSAPPEQSQLSHLLNMMRQQQQSSAPVSSAPVSFPLSQFLSQTSASPAPPSVANAPDDISDLLSRLVRPPSGEGERKPPAR